MTEPVDDLTDDLVVQWGENHKKLDVRWIEDEIRSAFRDGRIKRSTRTAFIGACRRAIDEHTHQRGARPKANAAPATERPRGGWTTAGRWQHGGSFDAPASRFVRMLCSIRVREHSTPAILAQRALDLAEQHRFNFNVRDVLPSLDVWLQLGQPEQQRDSWHSRHAQGINSAETAIRYGGKYRIDMNLDALHREQSIRAIVVATDERCARIT